MFWQSSAQVTPLNVFLIYQDNITVLLSTDAFSKYIHPNVTRMVWTSFLYFKMSVLIVYMRYVSIE